MQIFNTGFVGIHCPGGATRKLDRQLDHVDYAACPYVTSPNITQGNVCKDDNVTIVHYCSRSWLTRSRFRSL